MKTPPADHQPKAQQVLKDPAILMYMRAMIGTWILKVKILAFLLFAGKTQQKGGGWGGNRQLKKIFQLPSKPFQGDRSRSCFEKVNSLPRLD